MKEETGYLFGPDTGKGLTKTRQPLSDRMRPTALEEFVGQEHLLAPGKPLRDAIERDHLFSLVFWGPPGCGKTALAHIMAHTTRSHFVSFSAVLSGVKEIREVLHQAAMEWSQHQRRTILFVDEIHRFNKAQQDAFLPHVESGRLILVGATTENPSFEVNAALLSRLRVLVLYPLSEMEIESIIAKAITDVDRGLGRYDLVVEPDALQFLSSACQGDARQALNALELSCFMVMGQGVVPCTITRNHVEEAFQKKALLYDKSGEEHYNLISAFIKSLRGSDPDAALYWMVRMLEGGEDPLFIARRMVIFASEDIGNADPVALQTAVAVKEAVDFVGMPEAILTLSHGVTYLATAPKSNASYKACEEARRAVSEHGALPVPMHLRNAPTRLMKDLGYSKGYRYPHDAPEGFVEEQYLPEGLEGSVFYRPTNRGGERIILERLTAWRIKRSGKGRKKGVED